jgi:Ca2+/Na+ antiporter
MESFYIELNEMSHKKPRIIKLWIIGAAVLVVLLVLSFVFFASKGYRVVWLLLAAAIYLGIYIYYAYITYNAKMYIQADEFALEYKFGLISRTVNTYMWDTVSKVRLGPAYLAFYKRTGKERWLASAGCHTPRWSRLKIKFARYASTRESPARRPISPRLRNRLPASNGMVPLPSCCFCWRNYWVC